MSIKTTPFLFGKSEKNINMKRERIGPKIKKLRKSKGLTQKQMADTLGYSDKSMITHIEKGDSDMTYEKILVLLREYLLDANELFDVSEIDTLIKKQQEEKRTELLKKMFFNPVVDYLKYAKEIDCTAILSNDTVYFKPVTSEEDLIYCCFECELKDEQKDLVNPPFFSIARAYLNPNNVYPFIIYDKLDNKIGFICLLNWLGKGDAFSFSLLIDKHHQRKGYGTNSIKLAIDILKTIDDKKPIKISVEKANEKAQKLYESLGFKKLDELDGDDLVYSL